VSFLPPVLLAAGDLAAAGALVAVPSSTPACRAVAHGCCFGGGVAAPAHPGRHAAPRSRWSPPLAQGRIGVISQRRCHGRR
jgi:hypothetical protein